MTRPLSPNSQAKEMQEYLLAFMPTLTEGLTELTLQRPQDAYAFLAQYLLQRSAHPQAEDLSRSILSHALDRKQEAVTLATPRVPSAAVRRPAPQAVAPVPAGPLRIIIAGAPCSGKGTQCELIKERYGVVHISTGDLLRSEIAAGTALGTQAQTYMNEGKLIPDELIIDIVKEKVQGKECRERGFLLDGFPRTSGQAAALKAANIPCDVFLQLQVPDPVVISRVTGRRTDLTTGRSYHIVYDPPPADIAERCIQRSDDTEEKIATRLQQYHAQIAAIQQHYQQVKVEVDGNQRKEQITQQIFQELDRRAGKGQVDAAAQQMQKVTL